MAWTIPQYTRAQVDAAGQVLIHQDMHSTASIADALAIANNWRSSHAFPLNTMQMTLRNISRNIDRHSLVAQRIKRRSSIEAKLRRFDWLSLSRMQDIGGCRVVLGAAHAVDRVIEAYRKSQIKHRLLRSDDYIATPKSSGYRGYHLIYRYYSDRQETYNGLRIEMQIRSKLQHVWATAVETVGAFTQQELKSSEGENDWLRFFALMSTVLARKEERPIVPETPENHADLIGELEYYAEKLDVGSRLEAYRTAVRVVSDDSRLGNVRYFLLQIDSERRRIRIRRFRSGDFEQASAAYVVAEREVQDAIAGDAVLVSVESLASLKRAYPNYFFDIRLFRQEVETALTAR